MFTGIVKDIGKVVAFNRKNPKVYSLIIETNNICPSVDDSVAINGVCQTLVKKENSYLYFECVQSTLEKTNFNKLSAGDLVNLELALRLDQRLDGHFVTGHVNTCGKIQKIINFQDSYQVYISLDKKFNKYICNEGSITVNGVSLTINHVTKNAFSVFIIPHTWTNTSFKSLNVGSFVNLEFDILIKYLESLIGIKNEKQASVNAINEILK